jgi:hypothetical protein
VGEGGLGGGVDVEQGAAAAASRHLPTNVWAWKALGIVELVRTAVASSASAHNYIRPDAIMRLPSKLCKRLSALNKTIMPRGFGLERRIIKLAATLPPSKLLLVPRS